MDFDLILIQYLLFENQNQWIQHYTLFMYKCYMKWNIELEFGVYSKTSKMF